MNPNRRANWHRAKSFTAANVNEFWMLPQNVEPHLPQISSMWAN